MLTDLKARQARMTGKSYAIADFDGHMDWDGGWGVVMPVGALGAGVGSAIATGIGAGRGAALGAGLGGGGGAGGGGMTFGGAGGAMNSLSSSAGTITSAALRTRPDCRAQMPATCSATTERPIKALRLTPQGEAKR